MNPKYNVPSPLAPYLDENEYWHAEYGDIGLTIERVNFEGQDLISFQFEIAAEEEGGYILEENLRAYIQVKHEGLAEQLRSDSELAACVLWTDNQQVFDIAVAYGYAFLAAREVENET